MHSQKLHGAYGGGKDGRGRKALPGVTAMVEEDEDEGDEEDEAREDQDAGDPKQQAGETGEIEFEEKAGESKELELQTFAAPILGAPTTFAAPTPPKLSKRRDTGTPQVSLFRSKSLLRTGGSPAIGSQVLEEEEEEEEEEES